MSPVQEIFLLFLDPPIWSEEKIKFLQYNITQASYPGERTILNCSVCANPKPSFYWLLNGSAIKDNITTTDNLLVINDTMESDFGTYTCIATNTIFGQNESSYFYFNLVHYGPPKTPELIVEQVTHISIHLIWTAGYNGGTEQFFTLEYKAFNEINFRRWGDLIGLGAKDGDVLNVTIHGLQYKTLYNIRLLAINHNTIGINQSESNLNVTTQGLFKISVHE